MPDTARCGGAVAPASLRGRPRSRRSNSASVRRPPATSSIVPTSTRFMWRMNVSASIQNSDDLAERARRRHSRADDVALEAAGGRCSVGVKAVKSCVPGSTAAHASSAARSSACGHQGRDRARRGRHAAREEPVHVRAAEQRRGGRRSRQEPPPRPARRSSSGSTRVERPQARHRPVVGHDLPERMDPAVGPAGDGQVDLPAQHDRRRARARPRPSAARAARPTRRTGRRRTPESVSWK